MGIKYTHTHYHAHVSRRAWSTCTRTYPRVHKARVCTQEGTRPASRTQAPRHVRTHRYTRYVHTARKYTQTHRHENTHPSDTHTPLLALPLTDNSGTTNGWQLYHTNGWQVYHQRLTTVPPTADGTRSIRNNRCNCLQTSWPFLKKVSTLQYPPARGALTGERPPRVVTPAKESPVMGRLSAVETVDIMGF